MSKNMFQGIKNSWDLIKESIKVFNHYPKFIVPLLIIWLIYAPIILYLKYLFNWDVYSNSQIFLIVFGIIFFFAFLLSFSCSILLELIQQLESGQLMSVTKAFGHTLSHNMIRILPIVFIWTIVWFVLLVIQVLLSKSKKRGIESFSAENAAKTLAGYQNFSLSETFFKALQKGVRMIVFLMLPAIAWENLSFWQSILKGIAVFNAQLSAFITGFVLSSAATIIIFLPPLILFYISDITNIIFRDWVWVVTIIYTAFAWSYSMYLEQMFIAELYLWNYKWEKEVEKARREGREIPEFYRISMPSLLDDVHELVNKSEVRI